MDGERMLTDREILVQALADSPADTAVRKRVDSCPHGDDDQDCSNSSNELGVR